MATQTSEYPLTLTDTMTSEVFTHVFTTEAQRVTYQQTTESNFPNRYEFS